MAHKHNRRRVRTRSRNNNFLKFTYDLSDNTITSLKPSAPYPASIPETSPKQPSLPPMLRNPSTTVTAKHWQNRYVAWQNRDMAQIREAVKLEAEQIKLFGGEPGDDVGLCYKMMELFERMNWIDTLD
ncbi:hypothetical protein PV05_06323 [Exophiala xenobiotica]|uniref:Uncharacterized protein n=1 Tax=Exophiala xenobiotica TaxID=348802 RepID=A0A0D2EH48_9EURO|nr:uncharacterized protein PV05_06323 [Exophiala xenobiotica]KIW53915.1 hypothetical protein PV05_06323 [Exophiala xenobiotica]